MSASLMNGDVTAIAAAIAANELSPVAAMEETLERIASCDSAVQAYVHLNPGALQQAHESGEVAKEGRKLGLLHGVPIAIKDNYLTADMPTTAGSDAPGYRYARKDAAAVARLRAAGAVLIGKTRTHEFAWGTETPPTKNPWDLTRIPGGSSGGSGAAVAARMAYAALGSDTGGSIRIPASLCGVVGLKPTFGRVSRAGIVPHSWSLDHAGPLTRTVRDAALLLQVLAGHDPDDTGSIDVPVPNYRAALGQDIAGLRIGVCRNHFFGHNEAEVEAKVESAIADLAALGATIVDFEVPNLQYGLGAIFAIELASSAAFHDRGMQRGATSAMADDVRTLIDIGRLVSGADYLKAEQFRTLLIQDFTTVFERVDVVVTPSSPVTAWECGQRTVVTGGREESPLSASWRLTYPFNLTGLPALSVPCGFDSRGLPVGLQIAGKPFDESTVLRVGHAYEAVHQWHTIVAAVADKNR